MSRSRCSSSPSARLARWARALGVLATVVSASRAGEENAKQVATSEVSAADWSGIRAAYETNRHAMHAVAGGFQARNPGQRWTARFDGRGVEVVPGAEQCISYGMPAFKVQGKTVAGFAAFKNHLSYLPHSGSVLSAIPDDVAAYETTKGSLKFPVDEPLPRALVEKLVITRLRELGPA